MTMATREKGKFLSICWSEDLIQGGLRRLVTEPGASRKIKART